MGDCFMQMVGDLKSGKITIPFKLAYRAGDTGRSCETDEHVGQIEVREPIKRVRERISR